MADTKAKDDEDKAKAEAVAKQRAEADAKARAAHHEAVFNAPQQIGKLLAQFTNEEKVRILQSVRLLLGLGANNNAPRSTNNPPQTGRR